MKKKLFKIVLGSFYMETDISVRRDNLVERYIGYSCVYMETECFVSFRHSVYMILEKAAISLNRVISPN